MFLQVGEDDLGASRPATDLHNWVSANQNMARELAAKDYHYRFVFARDARHSLRCNIVLLRNRRGAPPKKASGRPRVVTESQHLIPQTGRASEAVTSAAPSRQLGRGAICDRLARARLRRTWRSTFLE
ncbi:MAG TPA: hypothetical protein VL242_31740 [Sorangium sp.]|nr:hypothetical protein [Sorangium sp.]